MADFSRPAFDCRGFDDSVPVTHLPQSVMTERSGAILMSDQAHLILAPWVKGQLVMYKCSLCEQTFVFPEDRSFKDGAAELWAAFRDHVMDQHPEDKEQHSEDPKS